MLYPPGLLLPRRGHSAPLSPNHQEQADEVAGTENVQLGYR